MSHVYSTPTVQTKKPRAASQQWIRFFKINFRETFYIGRNLFSKSTLFSARRLSNGQRVNVNPLSLFRSTRPYVAKKN